MTETERGGTMTAEELERELPFVAPQVPFVGCNALLLNST